MTYFKYLLLSIILLSVKTSLSQSKADVGIFAGTSYYLGDINPDNHFYSVSPSFGGLYRLSFNSRYAVKLQFTYGNFNGRDADFVNQFQRIRNASFSTSLLDISMVGEYNFLPFKFDIRKKSFTPFLFVGLAYDHILTSNTQVRNHLSLPFGIGIKYYLQKNVKIGIDWSMRKTFSDEVDGVVNLGGDQLKTFFNNNDWYSFTGIFITFGLFGDNIDCPAYQ